jgi:hypothetical protein
MLTIVISIDVASIIESLSQLAISSPRVKSEESVESVVNNVLQPDLNTSRDYKFIIENDKCFVLVVEF